MCAVNHLYYFAITLAVCAPQLRSLGVRGSTLAVNASNAEEFTFSMADYYGHQVAVSNRDGVRVGDGGLLVLDECGRAGKQQFCK